MLGILASVSIKIEHYRSLLYSLCTGSRLLHSAFVAALQ